MSYSVLREGVCVCVCVRVWGKGEDGRQAGERLLQMLLRDPGTELCWDESEPVPSEGQKKKQKDSELK